MNRTVLAIAVMASFFCMGTWAAAEPPVAPPAAPAPAVAPLPVVPMPLDKAVADHLVKVRGLNPEAYQKVDLEITSTSKEPVTVDLAGRYLKSRTSGCQRLGLSHPVTPSDDDLQAMVAGGAPPRTVARTLQPGQTIKVRMHSCCMDPGKPTPRSVDEFVLAPEPPPPVVETALRWWVEHPAAPQGFVNSAIWQMNADLLSNPWEAGAAPRSPSEPTRPYVILPKGRRVCAYAGMAYLLTDGDLIRLDDEGVRSFVGSSVHQAIPQADGLIGVGLGVKGREVWRFAQTGEPPWSKKFVIEMDRLAPAEWPDMVPAAGGACLLLWGGEVSFRSASGAVKPLMSAGDGALSMDVAPADPTHSKFVIVVHRAGNPGTAQAQGGTVAQADTFTVWDVDATGAGKAVERKTFWNAGDIAAGLAGTYALSHSGNLERLEGERFVRESTSERFLHIVAVGLARIVLAGDAGNLLSYDIATGRATPLALPPSAVKRTGTGLARSGLSIDPVTDDLLWIEGIDFKRLKHGATEVETLR